MPNPPLPDLPSLAALLGIDLDDPADADDRAALADLLVRRELRALRDSTSPPWWLTAPWATHDGEAVTGTVGPRRPPGAATAAPLPPI